MAKKKEQKAVVVEKLENAFKTAISSVFLHFRGLSVADETAIRRSLRNDDVSYVVAKKTLIRRALSNLGHKHEGVTLEGEVAVAHGGNDATTAARMVHEFAKKFAGKLTILGGIFEGRIVGQAEMQEIATIPSMQVLRGMFANIVNSPVQRFAIALSEVAKVKTN